LPESISDLPWLLRATGSDATGVFVWVCGGAGVAAGADCAVVFVCFDFALRW
jgi:hypothetical protein